MLINHPHHFITDAKSLIESDTLVEGDCRHVAALSILVTTGRVSEIFYRLVEISLNKEIFPRRDALICNYGRVTFVLYRNEKFSTLR